MSEQNSVNKTAKSIRVIRKLAYSIPELAQQTSLCRNSLYDAMNDGALIGRKYGNRTIVMRADAIRWLRSLPSYRRDGLEYASMEISNKTNS